MAHPDTGMRFFRQLSSGIGRADALTTISLQGAGEEKRVVPATRRCDGLACPSVLGSFRGNLWSADRGLKASATGAWRPEPDPKGYELQ